MTLNRSASVLMSVLLVLTVAAVTTLHRPTGFLIDLARAVDSRCFFDGRIIVATLRGGHTAQLNNSDPMQLVELESSLREIFYTRADRTAFVTVDADISYQEFVDFIDAVRRQVDRISLITPQVKEQLTGCMVPVLGCGLCANRKPQ